MSRIWGNMSLYAVDLFTDSWLLFNTVLKSTDPNVKRLIPYWIVCWAVATVVSSVSMFIKVKVRHFSNDLLSMQCSPGICTSISCPTRRVVCA